jgi:PBP1b-binding outer membrane lipoprotein LpoB
MAAYLFHCFLSEGVCMKKLAVLAAVVCFFLVCSDPSQAKEKKKKKEQQDKPVQKNTLLPDMESLPKKHIF